MLAQKLTAVILTVSVGACSVIDTRLRTEIFRPSREVPSDFAPNEHGLAIYRSFVPSTPSNKPAHSLEFWLKRSPNPAAPTLLFLHGRAGNLYSRENVDKINLLVDCGFSVLAVDYRGWGNSTVILPSEDSLYADAEAAWDELARLEPRAHARVIFGHSLGGAIAVELAVRKKSLLNYATLVLESTFSSLEDLAVAQGHSRLVTPFMSLKFDSASKMPNVVGRIWVLHGDADNVVPLTLGRKLWESAPSGAHWVALKDGVHDGPTPAIIEAYSAVLRHIADSATTGAPASSGETASH